MKLLRASLCFLFLGCQSVSAQTVQPVNRTDLTFGTGLVSGKSKIDRTSPVYSAPLLSIGPNRVSKNFEWDSRAENVPGDFGGFSHFNSIRGNILKVKRVNFFMGAQYFSAFDKDVVWDYQDYAIEGNTLKRYLFLSAGAGTGDYRKRNFGITMMAGATQMRKTIRIFSEGRELENSPALVDRDILPVLGIEARAAFPGLWKKFSLKLSVRNIRTQDIGNRKNTRELIPKSQFAFNLEIRKALSPRFDSGLSATWTNADTGMVFLGNSAQVKAIYKFKKTPR